MKHKGLLIILLTAIGLIATILWIRSHPTPLQQSIRFVTAERGTLEAWTTYDGIIMADSIQTVMSEFKGKTSIIYLIPEGASVTQGTLLVEFDSSQLEQDITRLKHEISSAEAALNSLQYAELPMEITALNKELLEAEYNYRTEKDYLEDSRELLADSLISTQEVFQQEHKVAMLNTSLNQLQSKLELTTNYLHPTRLQRSRNELDALKNELDEAQRQLLSCRIISPASGMVSYTPLHISGEFRNIRIGDSVNQNQPFMNIPDMNTLEVTCYVPEADLSRVQPGYAALVQPVAFPGMVITGQVKSVGAMAQRRPGKPRWQKYFYVTVTLDALDPRLRTGMSANVNIRSCHLENVLLLPRTTIIWENGIPYCMPEATPDKLQTLQLGKSNDGYFEVISGISEGEQIRLP